MGRPPTKPKKLKDGFYIEICNKGSKVGIKIRRDSRELMQEAIKSYEKTKDIIIHGELKSGKWVQDNPKAHKLKE